MHESESSCSVIRRSARFHLYNIDLARKYLIQEAAEKAILDFVLSRLESGNGILYELSACQIKRLQQIQNAATRILTGVPRATRMTPVLRKLHQMPVSCRTKYEILLLAAKCLHGLALGYLA